MRNAGAIVHGYYRDGIVLSLAVDKETPNIPLICHHSETHRYDTYSAAGQFHFGSTSEDGHESTMCAS